MSSLPDLQIEPDMLASLSHIEKSRMRRRHDVKRGAHNYRQLLRITRPPTIRSVPGIDVRYQGVTGDEQEYQYSEVGMRKRQIRQLLTSYVKEKDAVWNNEVQKGGGTSLNSFDDHVRHVKNLPYSDNGNAADHYSDKLPTLDKSLLQKNSSDTEKPSSVTFRHCSGQVTVFPPFLQKTNYMQSNRNCDSNVAKHRKGGNKEKEKDDTRKDLISKGRVFNSENQTGRKQIARKENREELPLFDYVSFQGNLSDFQKDNTRMILARVDNLLQKPKRRTFHKQISSLGLYNRIPEVPRLPSRLRDFTRASHLLHPCQNANEENDLTQENEEFTDHLENLPKANVRFPIKCEEWLQDVSKTAE